MNPKLIMVVFFILDMISTQYVLISTFIEALVGLKAKATGKAKSNFNFNAECQCQLLKEK